MSKHFKGSMVVFEGCDGSGKTTLIKSLQKYLEDHNIKAHYTKEPGGSKLGEELRSIILDRKTSISNVEEVLLFMAARSNATDMLIDKHLNDDDSLVICDRYTASTYAYQLSTILDEDKRYELRKVIDMLTDVVALTPTVTVYLDISPEVCFERINNRGDKNYFDAKGIDFHKRVAEEYKRYFDNEIITGRLTKNKIIYIPEDTPENMLEQLVVQLREKGVLR